MCTDYTQASHLCDITRLMSLIYSGWELIYRYMYTWTNTPKKKESGICGSEVCVLVFRSQIPSLNPRHESVPSHSLISVLVQHLTVCLQPGQLRTLITCTHVHHVCMSGGVSCTTCTCMCTSHPDLRLPYCCASLVLHFLAVMKCLCQYFTCVHKKLVDMYMYITMCKLYLHCLAQENGDQEALHCGDEMLLIREDIVAPYEQEHQQCWRTVMCFQVHPSCYTFQKKKKLPCTHHNCITQRGSTIYQYMSLLIVAYGTEPTIVGFVHACAGLADCLICIDREVKTQTELWVCRGVSWWCSTFY